jgi:hypothetical protein
VGKSGAHNKWGVHTHLVALDFYGHINMVVAPERRQRLTSMMDTQKPYTQPRERQNSTAAEEGASS